MEIPATPRLKSNNEASTTMKSSTFHPLHIYGFRPLIELRQKPMAMILSNASTKNKNVKMLSTMNRTALNRLLGSFSGLSIAIVMLLAMIRNSTVYSKMELYFLSRLYSFT